MYSLPTGPAELCFDKNEFMKASFSVDGFLHDHKNAASLEAIRDDLGIYLKVLRSAMIELINEDYGDFVNLSVNLMGLDESLNTIQNPLKKLEDDVLNIKFVLEENMQGIKDLLDQKKHLRMYKRDLNNLAKVHTCIHKLGELIKLLGDNSDPVILERATLELVKLKFNSKFCSQYLNTAQAEQVNNLHSQLLGKIKMYFLSSLKSTSAELERCLRIYVTLDECDMAEIVFRTEVVRPYMSQTISEQTLQNSPQGLMGLYQKVLDFIPLRMKELLLLTQHTNNVKGFNFLLNSFWKEVEIKIESQMASIFAPGNPETFFAKYTASQNFVTKLESFFKNDKLIDSFHESDEFKNFQLKWNLPVYFQIRFQEIAGSLESTCERSAEDIYGGDNPTGSPLIVAYTSIAKCWDHGIYIDKLFAKLWKLSLQIVSRSLKWISDNLQNMKKKTENSRWLHILVAMYLDTLEFKSKINKILDLVDGKIPAVIQPDKILLENSISDAEQQINGCLEKIEVYIVNELVLKSLVHMKLVSDIPRLYRKTNRETPNKHCSYVEQMIEQPNKFQNEYAKRIGNEKMKRLLVLTFSRISKGYYSAVADVLTSVQKTEESLRRLKNLREKQSTSLSAVSDRCALTDDDKIRLQLQADIQFWIQKIEELGISRIDIKELTDLINLVEDISKLTVAAKLEKN